MTSTVGNVRDILKTEVSENLSSINESLPTISVEAKKKDNNDKSKNDKTKSST